MGSPSGSRVWLDSLQAQNLVVRGREVVTVNTTDSVEDGLQTLIKNSVLSAPIVDRTTGECHGLVDMTDVLCWAVQVYGDYSDVGDDALIGRMKQGFKFSLEKVDNLANLSGRDPYKPCKLDTPLRDIIEILASGVHRLPVLDDSGKIIDIISQSSIVEFFAHNLSHLEPVCDGLVSEVMTKGVLTGSMHDKTIDCLVQMVARGVSSMAIVDGSGALLETLSVTDLRRLAEKPASSFHHILSSRVRTFLAPPAESIVDVRSPAVTISEKDTIGKFLLKSSAIRVHRLWVADNHNKPIGVVSLSDTLRYFQKRLSN